MPITEEKVIRMVEITKTAFDDWCDALLAEFQQKVSLEHVGDIHVLDAIDDPDSEEDLSLDIPWSFEGIELPHGGWTQVGEPQEGVTYRWPDGSIGTFNPFVTYEGTGGKAGVALALGYNSKNETVGFVLGSNGWKRGLTVFFQADDFASSNEKLSMIKGGGPRGRSGFGPGDALPDAYAGFKTEMLGDRVTGKWNREAVVAKADDHETMLDHTLLQARLRGLV